MIDRDSLEAELKELQAKAGMQYWQFCRCAQAKPVDPALTRRVAEIEELLGKPQPWQKTQAQVLAVWGMPVSKHKQYVEQALLDDKPVPENVLAQYPELKEIPNE